MVIVKFQKEHFMFTIRTVQWIVFKRRKDSSPPSVETANVRFTPIEKMWSKMKSFLRKRKVCVAAELPEAVKAALETISTNDCKEWFHASGICVN